MIYETSYRDPRGLSGLAVNILGFTGVSIACGVDQNGNAYVMAGNQYFYDTPSLYNFGLNTSSHEASVVWSAFMQTASRLGQSNQMLWPNFSMNDIVGTLRLSGVPFAAYVPPPAPTPIAPTVPASPGGPPTASAPAAQPAQVMPATLYQTGDKYGTVFGAFGWYWIVEYNGNYYPVPGMAGDAKIMVLPNTPDASHATFYASNYPQYGHFVHDITKAYDFKANGFYDSSASPGILPSYVAVSLTPPAGFSVLPANWSPGMIQAWPVYGTNPTFDANGVASFAGAQGFGALTSSLMPGVSSIGLDPQKLSLGLYAFRENDLGAITLSNNRTYELYLLEIFDMAKNTTVGSFYETREGGGAGLLISHPIDLAGRIITGVGTFGTSEALRAAAQKAGVPDSTINLAINAYAAASIAVATAGLISVASAAPATTAIEETAATPLLTGQEAATFVSAAPEVAGEVAATGGVVAPTGGLLATTVTGGGAALTKAAAAAIVSTGATALSTEIKKLTGQLPNTAKPPTQIVTTPQTVSDAGSTTVSPILKWGIAALAGLAILKKHAS